MTTRFVDTSHPKAGNSHQPKKAESSTGLLNGNPFDDSAATQRIEANTTAAEDLILEHASAGARAMGPCARRSKCGPCPRVHRG